MKQPQLRRRVASKIREIGNFAVKDGAAHVAAVIDRNRRLPQELGQFGRDIRMPLHHQHVAFAKEQCADVSSTQFSRRAGERIHDSFEIERRPADDLQHVGGRGLLLQRFREIAGARLHLVEQPHILDRDHRLVGEGLQQLHVMRDKRSRLDPRRADHADGFVIAHQGREQHAAKTARSCEIPEHGRSAGLSLGVGDLRRLTIADQFEDREFGERAREHTLQQFIGRRIGRRERLQVHQAVDEAKHRGGKAAKQPVGAGGNRFEHRLHIVRRTGDDLEDVGGGGLPLQRLLGFVEQPGIGDGDDGLIGKGLQQLDMVIGKRPRVLARNADEPDRRLVAHQRREQHAAIAPHSRKLAVDGRHIFRFGIGELDGLAVADQFEDREFGHRPRE